VLDSSSLPELVSSADILLVADYHALPASQRFAASLIGQLAKSGSRPIVLGLETIFSRDQHIVDEWLRKEIGDHELRERLRFDLDWGYDWEPFSDLLESARSQGSPIYGLDCMPREDLRKIGARDRHAAAKITEIRQEHPSAQIVVVFGESHLAPNHLPQLLRHRLPSERVVTILQNVDALYWRAARESRDRVDAVQVSEDVVCVFTATPLEKYENYRLCLDRWSREGGDSPDLRPTIYNLIYGLLRFLGINLYSPHNTTQPRFLVDSLPEVHSRNAESTLRKLLSRQGASKQEKREQLARLEEWGSTYLASTNTFYIREFQMMHAAEDAARFLHHACRGLPQRRAGAAHAQPKRSERIPASEILDQTRDIFYCRVLENAFAYFGSRVLCPARPAAREAELYELYDLTHEDVQQQTSFDFPEFIGMIDFLALHRGYELNPRRYPEPPQSIVEGLQFTDAKFDYVTRQLGYMLGSDLYDAYLDGLVTRRFLKKLFLLHIESPGAAPRAYFAIVRKVRPAKKRTRATN